MATDKTIECIDCGDLFVWSASDQKFYEKKGYQEPKRCPECRKKKRAQRERQGTA